MLTLLNESFIPGDGVNIFLFFVFMGKFYVTNICYFLFLQLVNNAYLVTQSFSRVPFFPGVNTSLIILCLHA